MKWVFRGLYVLYLALCLALGTVGYLGYHIAEGLAGKGGSIAEVWQGISNPRSLFPGQDQVTVLVVGRDYNRTRAGIAFTKNSRSDTIMMLAIDLRAGTVRACSVPRDTYVDAPDGRSGKINGTFARGGIDLLRETLTQLLGVGIDHYVVIKPDAVRNIVDAVGGVEVETIDEMHYNDNWGGLHIDLAKGRQGVNGEQAEGFVRFREVNRYRVGRHGAMIPLHGVKGSLEEGDLRRAARQQQLIHALMAAARSPRNLIRLGDIVEVGFSQVQTDLSRTQALALGTILRGGANKPMVSATVPGRDEVQGGAYYYLLDTDRARSMAAWLVNGDELAMRRATRVQVRNGSGTTGAARRLASLLEQQGFAAFASGNTSPLPTTRIEYTSASYAEAARLVKRVLGSGTVYKVAGPRSDAGAEVRVDIGSDLGRS